ncbi:MAG TPA: ABC transporter permease [Gemmatimonadaceae bacterium]|nr:ABC transporter permease [Gemmatimonadaceae bacterium]
MTGKRFRLADSVRNAKREVDDELAFHIEMRTRELIAEGLAPDEARRRAIAHFGDVGGISAELRRGREARNAARQRQDWWSAAKMDVGYSLRWLMRNRLFALASIVTLGLGIGATLAVVTVVNGVLVRPLPYHDPSRLAMIWMTEGEPWDLPLSSGFYIDIAREARNVNTAAFRSWPSSLARDGDAGPDPVTGARVTPGFFDVLGVHPIAGQPFTQAEAVPGAPRVAVISYDLWQRRFGGDSSIIGKPMFLSGEAHTVTGIMPPGFTYPRGAELPAPFQFGLRTDVWLPLVFDSSDARNYGTQNLSVIARVKDNVTFESAQAELTTIIKNFLDLNAPNLKLGYHVKSMNDQAASKVRRSLLILFGAVIFVLLVVCANVASLLIARVATRQRELALRATLGAGHGRIARQLVTENLVLAFAGTLVGVVIANVVTRVMLAMVPGSMPRADDIGVDWRVAVFAGAVAVLAGVAFGLAAASSVRWNQLAASLHAGGLRTIGTIRQRLGRRLLVISEVALSLILLIGATLLTRSFVRLQQTRPGFDPNEVLTANVGLPVGGRFNPIADGPRWATALNALTARLGQSPGVVAAGATSALPLSGAIEGGGLAIPGRPPDPPGKGPRAQYSVVSGNYFAAARIGVAAGRVFDGSDDAPGVRTIVVNREFARLYLGGDQNAVGKDVQALFDFVPNSPTRRVVGVVETVKLASLDEDATPQVYVPESQFTYPGLALVVRTNGNPRNAIETVRAAVREVSPQFTISEIRTFSDVFSLSLARQRFSMTLIGAFAILALTLAVVGLYGVLSLLVGQRSREIGVRLALGATRRDVMRLVVWEGGRIALIGVVIGVVGALAMTRLLATMVYEVGTRDLATFVGATAIVVVVSLFAAVVPARRASRLDPNTALASE